MFTFASKARCRGSKSSRCRWTKATWRCLRCRVVQLCKLQGKYTSYHFHCIYQKVLHKNKWRQLYVMCVSYHSCACGWIHDFQFLDSASPLAEQLIDAIYLNTWDRSFYLLFIKSSILKHFNKQHTLIQHLVVPVHTDSFIINVILEIVL